MTLLSISGLKVSLAGRPVLRDVSLSVAPGEFVGLVGPNGAGKSTLLRAALGLVPASGQITIAGRDAAVLSATRRAREIAYLPQDHEIVWPLTVAHLVALGRMPYRRGPLRALDEADHAAIEAAMRRMEVLQFRDRPATELSGGEKVRVLIARALAQQTPLVLADEPTAGLDPAHQIELMRTFADLAAEAGGVVASLHDLGLAARWCTRLILLHRGAVIADGKPEEVLTPERLHSIYGIRAYIGEADGGMILQPLDTERHRQEKMSS